MIKTPPLTLGVEEEYMLIDPHSRALANASTAILEAGKAVLGDHIKAEFLQSQIEVSTSICEDIRAVRLELGHLRRTVSQLAEQQGKRIAAASTHPFSTWREQVVSPYERYQDLYNDMQDAARRLVIFGLHVHVGFGNDRPMQILIIDIMNQLRYFLPHILALSTSSPFWHGRDTGLKSYRSLIFQNMPRTGIPPIFNDYDDYDRFVDLLARAGSLGKGNTKDASRIWWDIRPNPRLGTLEVRVADICTTIDEAVCITAVIQALTAKLLKLRLNNQSWRLYRSDLIQENKWRAARYGLEAQIIDFGIEEAFPLPQLWEEILELVDDVVDDLNVRTEVEYVRHILQHGTSADRQLAVYHQALAEGQPVQDALVRVMDLLLAETAQGIQ